MSGATSTKPTDDTSRPTPRRSGVTGGSRTTRSGKLTVLPTSIAAPTLPGMDDVVEEAMPEVEGADGVARPLPTRASRSSRRGLTSLDPGAPQAVTPAEPPARAPKSGKTKQTSATTARPVAPQSAAATATAMPSTEQVSGPRKTRSPRSGALSSAAAAAAAAAPMPAPVVPSDPAMPKTKRSPRSGALPRAPRSTASALPATDVAPQEATAVDPDVWLIALPTPLGGMRALDVNGGPGAIRVTRPYGYLREVRPVLPPGMLRSGKTAPVGSRGPTGRLEAVAPAGLSSPQRARTPSRPLASAAPAAAVTSSAVTSSAVTSSAVASAAASMPTPRALDAAAQLAQITSAVEIETDAGVFRVERPGASLGHSDLAWALANLEAGEPDALVPLPRRQLALLLTLLPTAEDPDHPELDPTWGWAHRLRGPWERGPLHDRGRLGKLVAVDPDPAGRGMHRACFELLGSEDVVWALGVPCFQPGSVYELVPLSRSRFLSWPLSKTRTKGTADRPAWEIARVVYRIGAPRWPLAGVIKELGPLGSAG